MALRGIPSVAPPTGVGKPTGATNLVSNGGFETNTTGWSDGGNFTVSRSTTVSKTGAASGKCTVDNTAAGNDSVAAQYGVTCATTTQYTLSVYVYIPSTWTGGQVTCEFRDLTAPTILAQTNVNMAITDAWQRITVTATTGANASCGLRCVADNIKAGEFFYLDNLQIELGPRATAYIPTDGGAATRNPRKWVA